MMADGEPMIGVGNEDADAMLVPGHRIEQSVHESARIIATMKP
ncbi:hypothetical protein ACRAWG_29155 [Methylobacterium sp. P31]